MPLYEYRCKGCDHRFETLVRRDETPACPKCEGSDLEKLLSSFAVGAGGGDPLPRAAGPCASCPSARGCGMA